MSFRVNTGTTPRRQRAVGRQFWFLGAAWLGLFGGCGGELRGAGPGLGPDVAPPDLADSTGPDDPNVRELLCGAERYIVDGESYEESTVYNLDRINAELSESAEKRATTGLSSVNNCKEAALFHARLNGDEPSLAQLAAAEEAPASSGLTNKVLGGRAEGRRGSVNFTTWSWEGWNKPRSFCSGTLISQNEMVTS